MMRLKRWSIRNRDPLIFALLSVVYIVVRLILGLRCQTIQILVDTQDYIFNASVPLNFDFFLYSKPAGAALVYKLLGGSYESIFVFQVLFSIFSWLLLALTLAAHTRDRRVKPAGFSVVLLFSLSSSVLVWDSVILSESLSLSCMVLLIAACIGLSGRASLAAFVCVFFAGIGWALIKETNALLLALAALILLGTGLLLRDGMRFLITGVAFCLVFMLLQGFSNMGERWKFPLLNIMGQRVLVDAEMLAFFEGNDMPVNETLLELKHAWGNSAENAFLNSPDLRDFQAWFHDHGKHVYMRYLVRHPVRSLLDPLQNMDSVMSPDRVEQEGPGFIAAGWHPVLFGLYTAALIVCLYIAIFNRVRSHAWFTFLLLALCLPHLWVVWNGDAMEAGRHSLQLRVQLFLGLWLALFLLLDALLSRKENAFLPDWRTAFRLGLKSVCPLSESLQRGLWAGGCLLVVFAGLHDFILSPGYFDYRFQLGRGQVAGIAVGILSCLSAVGLHRWNQAHLKASGKAAE